MKKLLFASLLVLLFPLYSSAGMIYKTTIDGAKFYTNRKIDNYDKFWPEIEFDAAAHKARLARDIELMKKFDKEREMDLKALELRVKERRTKALEMAAMMNNRPPIVYNITSNYHASVPHYYKRHFYHRKPVYVYPNISTRQAHRRAGCPIIWR